MGIWGDVLCMFGGCIVGQLHFRKPLALGGEEHGTEQDLSLEHHLQEPGSDTVSWGQLLNLGPFLYKSIKWTLTLDLTPA